MRIGGLQKVSLIDFPGNVSAVVFTQGCNFRCPYCHNEELVYPELFSPVVKEERVFSHLHKRKKLLDGVVISGGEPTLQKDLEIFIREVKRMGFRIKLDTNGSNPDMIEHLLSMGFVDYVAMDVKAPLEKYEVLAGKKIDTEKIACSIALIRSSGVDHLFRTTVFRPLLCFRDLKKIVNLLGGDTRYVLQKCEFRKGMKKSILMHMQYPKNAIERFQERLRSHI
jgi:pyruvate formate lyase activating enzyme